LRALFFWCLRGVKKRLFFVLPRRTSFPAYWLIIKNSYFIANLKTSVKKRPKTGEPLKLYFLYGSHKEWIGRFRSDKSGLACCLYCIGSGWRGSFPSANGKPGPIPEEMLQILLINKKQGNLD
jgi:hypothetical protein